MFRVRQPQPSAGVLPQQEAGARQAEGAVLSVPGVARAAPRLSDAGQGRPRHRRRLLPLLQPAAAPMGELREDVEVSVPTASRG